MVKFRKTDIAKEKLYAAKRPIQIWGADGDNIVILKLVAMRVDHK